MPFKPLVSIVIPCFRQGVYLREAVDSALSQTWPRCEIIVVNDGSDDDTDSVAESYRDRILYVQRQNGGLSAARNSGLAVATGEYVVFLDADDALEASMVASCLETLDINRAQSVGAYCGCAVVLDQLDNILWTTEAPTRKLDFAAVSRWNSVGAHQVLVCRQAVEEAGRFDETLSSCEDWDLWAKILRSGGCLLPCPSSRVFYRLHAHSMTHDPVRMTGAAETVLRRHCAPQFLEDALAQYRGMFTGRALVEGTDETVAAMLELSEASITNSNVLKSYLAGVRHGVDRSSCRRPDPHRKASFYLGPLNRLLAVSARSSRLASMDTAFLGLLAEMREANDTVDRLNRLVEEYRNSSSYRIGRMITRLAFWKREVGPD